MGSSVRDDDVTAVVVVLDEVDFEAFVKDALIEAGFSCGHSGR